MSLLIAFISWFIWECLLHSGGYLGDVVYRRYGVPGKKHLTLALGVTQGILSIGLGVYIDSRESTSLAVVIVILVIIALFDEAGNGANFSLVPHCNPSACALVYRMCCTY